MTLRSALPRVAVALLVFGVPSVAYANAGLPMLVLVLPVGVFSLPVVIVIESGILERWLALPRSRALKLSGVANAVSTLLGVPLAWFVLVVVEMLGGKLVWRVVMGDAGPRDAHAFWQELAMVIWGAPWLLPIGDEPSWWVVPIALLALLVPFFFASYLIEARLVGRALPGMPEDRVRTAVWRANLTTYGLFAVAAFAWLVGRLVTGG